MSTQQQGQFTEAEVCHQAGVNAQGMSLGILAHARKHGEPAESALRWLGAIFAPGWEGIKGEGAFAAMRLAALNVVAVGGTLRSLSGDEHRAEATFGEWPADDDLAFFGISREDTNAMFAIFEPIAESLGLSYRWERRGDEFVLTIESAGA